jgi:hypothetical protein
VAGTLIVVQGFQTTRYLGSSFDANVRVSASRWSQIISTVVYIVFVAVTLPVVHALNGKYDDNSLIALVGVAASVLVVPLIVAAALSQFSAAVADTLAATGNMQETTHGQAMPMHWLATSTRPRSSTCMASLNPEPSGPMRAAWGSSQSKARPNT